jgi:hypothetical protein
LAGILGAFAFRRRAGHFNDRFFCGTREDSMSIRDEVTRKLRRYVSPPWQDEAADAILPLIEAHAAAREAAAVERVKNLGPLPLRVLKQENYSGEHREWMETYTIPKGCHIFDDIAAAIRQTATKGEGHD